MKKIISFLVVFFVSQKLAFSLNENDFKEFCESVNTRHIPIVNFCILTIYSDNENKSEEYKRIFFNPNQYCRFISNNWWTFRSYIRKDCVGQDFIFWDRETYSRLNFYEKNYYSDRDFEDISVSEDLQKKLAIFYESFKQKTKDFSPTKTENLAKKVIEKIEKFRKISKREVRNALLLLRYELENLYREQKYQCYWKLCEQNKQRNFYYDKWDYKEKNKKVFKFENDTEVLLKYWRNSTFGCYDGKTILKKNWKEKILIDDSVFYKEDRALCSVNAQIANDENIRLFVCYENWAGSWECGTMIFNFNVKTEKMTFEWFYYYSPENPFTVREYLLYDDNSGLSEIQISDLKKEKKEDPQRYEQSKIYFRDLEQSFKTIKKYFKEKYWIDNIKFNEEKVIEFLKNN